MTTDKVNSILKIALPAILIWITAMTYGQVTVGGGIEPQDFSKLEIVTNHDSDGGYSRGGLRLPRLTTAERDALRASAAFQAEITGKAKGLTIFNMTTNCVEIWSGSSWISICASVPTFSMSNVNSGETALYTSSVFVSGTGDDLSRGTGVLHGDMSAGVFSYTGGKGEAYGEVDYTDVSGVRVTIPAGTLANGSGEIAITVSGTVGISYAGKAFDIPVTILGQQLYVRVHVGCGAYTGATRTIPSLTGDPAWKQFQCFNLGADDTLDPFSYVVGNADGSGGTLGYLYQWGRPTDGHQLRTSATTTTLSTTDVPGHGDFILSGTTYDWRNPPNITLWGDGTQNENMAKTANDPCPAGWKVPSQKQWQSIFGPANATSDLATANTWTWTTDGFKVGSSLFLPINGHRDVAHGGIVLDTYGFYWSTTVDTSTSKSYLLFFIGSSSVIPSRRNFSGHGVAVRCMAE